MAPRCERFAAWRVGQMHRADRRQEGLGRATMETHPVQPGASVSIDLRKKDRVGVLSAASALGFKPLVFASDAEAVSVSVSADGTVSVTP